MEILAAEKPDAAVCLCNDLTKMHERVYRGSPRAVLDELCGNPSAQKGEYTLVAQLPPASLSSEDKQEPLTREALLVDYMVKNNATLKEAVNAMAQKHKNKKEWYAASLSLRAAKEACP
jgi:16S rRNA (cytidine1402-2'-O)-methyltransferase